MIQYKFSAYHSRKCCLDRFDFSDIANLIWHPCTDIVLKNWTYVQFKKVEEKPWILRVEILYDKIDKLDRFSKDFENTTVPLKVRCQSIAEVYDWGYSFKNRSINVVLVAEVGSWFKGESYNFKLCLLDFSRQFAD